MLCYIKDFKTFTTLAKYDATSWSLPEGTNGEVVIYQKNPVELTTKYVGMWLIINHEIFYISEATPNDDNISLEIQPPIYAFKRQVFYEGQTTYGALIAYILTNDYGVNCPDADYSLSYLSVTNTDATQCNIETDDYGYIIPCDIFDDALYYGVAIDFVYTNTGLSVQVYTANYETGVILFNDGKTVLESESYDPNFIAKATVLHRLEVVEEDDPEYEVIDYYLSADNQISTTPPQNRAKGVWKYYTAEIDENPLYVAIGAFSHNNNNHKIEFHSPTRFNLYQNIKMRLRGEIFTTIITSRVLSSEDDRYYYTCGNLATTLTEKIETQSDETSTEINSIKKRITNMEEENSSPFSIESTLYFPNQTVNVATNAEIFRITDESITTQTIVTEMYFAGVVYSVTWTSYDGYIAFYGTCPTATTADVTLTNTAVPTPSLPLAIAKGGTGANTAAGARANLGITTVNVDTVSYKFENLAQYTDHTYYFTIPNAFATAGVPNDATVISVMIKAWNGLGQQQVNVGIDEDAAGLYVLHTPNHTITSSSYISVIIAYKN